MGELSGESTLEEGLSPELSEAESLEGWIPELTERGILGEGGGGSKLGLR
jgi:hypothetical protein